MSSRLCGQAHLASATAERSEGESTADVGVTHPGGERFPVPGDESLTHDPRSEGRRCYGILSIRDNGLVVVSPLGSLHYLILDKRENSPSSQDRRRCSSFLSFYCTGLLPYLSIDVETNGNTSSTWNLIVLKPQRLWDKARKSCCQKVNK